MHSCIIVLPMRAAPNSSVVVPLAAVATASLVAAWWMRRRGWSWQLLRAPAVRALDYSFCDFMEDVSRRHERHSHAR